MEFRRLSLFKLYRLGRSLSQGSRRVVYHVVRGHSALALTVIFNRDFDPCSVIVRYFSACYRPFEVPGLRNYGYILCKHRRGSSECVSALTGLESIPHRDYGIGGIRCLNEAVSGHSLSLE